MTSSRSALKIQYFYYCYLFSNESTIDKVIDDTVDRFTYELITPILAARKLIASQERIELRVIPIIFSFDRL